MPVENDIYSIWKNGSGRNAGFSAQFMGYKNGVNKRQEPLLCLVFWLMSCSERSSEEETFAPALKTYFCTNYTCISSFLVVRLDLSVEFG